MTTPDDVLSFWLGAPAARRTTRSCHKLRRWFGVDKALDAEIRARFGDAVQRARDGALDDWAKTPRGRLGAHHLARPVHAQPAPRDAARVRERRARAGARRGGARSARGRRALVRGEALLLHAAGPLGGRRRARSATSRSSRRRSTPRSPSMATALRRGDQARARLPRADPPLRALPPSQRDPRADVHPRGDGFLGFSVDKRLRFTASTRYSTSAPTSGRPWPRSTWRRCARTSTFWPATVGPGVGILAVVKADAYGHGALAVRARARAQGVGLRRLAGRGGRRAAPRRHRGAHRRARQLLRLLAPRRRRLSA